jgi:membrane protein
MRVNAVISTVWRVNRLWIIAVNERTWRFGVGGLSSRLAHALRPVDAHAHPLLSRPPIPTRQLLIPGLGVLRRALSRLWGRDVMLYVGGVSFFALLAVFPALAILVGLYGLLAPPDQIEALASALSNLMPPQAQDLVQAELGRLVGASRSAVSVQSAFALGIGLYAAHRGFKALLAGLSFIYEEDNPRGFVRFNVLALMVAISAFAILIASSGAFLAVRVLASTFKLELLGQSWLNNEWTWESAGLMLGFVLLYRYAMASHAIGWRSSALGGAVAAAMSILASWACAFYVGRVANFGATYGSIGAVVVFLVWLSWNVNAVFFGGAVATEMELVFMPEGAPRRPRQLHPSVPRSAARNLPSS